MSQMSGTEVILPMFNYVKVEAPTLTVEGHYHTMGFTEIILQ